MSAEGVAETQAGFVQVILTEVLHQTVEVHTAATQELLQWEGSKIREAVGKKGGQDS